MIRHILSQLFIIQYVGLCVFSLPISLVIERTYILYLIMIIKSELWTITHCLGLGHETMVCAVCRSVFLQTPRGLVWYALTHWGRVTHICVGNLTIIGSDNGLSPGGHQAIIWTNAGILLIGPLGTNFSEIFIGIQTFSYKKMHLKMSSAKWRPFRVGLNVLTRRKHPESIICRLSIKGVRNIYVSAQTYFQLFSPSTNNAWNSVDSHETEWYNFCIRLYFLESRIKPQSCGI